MTLYDILATHLKENDTLEDVLKRITVTQSLDKEMTRGYGSFVDETVTAKTLIIFDGVEISELEDSVSIPSNY